MTVETDALNPTLVALAGTVTLGGTVTAELLLERATANPALGAAPLRVTVQASVPAAAMDTLVQVSAESAADETPVPLRLTTAVGLVEELLVMVSVPVNELAWPAENCIFSVAVCPGLRVSGVVTPDAVKSEPTIETAEMVTGALPAEDSVTGRVAVDPTLTLPKLRVVVLRTSVGVPVVNCKTKLLLVLFAVAVRVADCVEVNAETVAVKVAVVALAGTVNEVGTDTTESVLTRLTTSPPVGAAVLRVTVQASVPAPVMDALLQESELSVPADAAPVPARLMTAEGLVEELLVMVS